MNHLCFLSLGIISVIVHVYVFIFILYQFFCYVCKYLCTYMLPYLNAWYYYFSKQNSFSKICFCIQLISLNAFFKHHNMNLYRTLIMLFCLIKYIIILLLAGLGNLRFMEDTCFPPKMEDRYLRPHSGFFRQRAIISVYQREQTLTLKKSPFLAVIF